MTFRRARSLIGFSGTSVAAIGFILVPIVAVTGGLGFWWIVFLSTTMFIGLHAGRDAVVAAVEARARRRFFGRPETRVILEFSERVGQAFTLPDLVDAIRSHLELRADMSAILISSNTWDTIYASPTAVARDPDTLKALELNFREWSEGFCFMKEDLSISNDNVGARGFFIYSKGFHLFILTRLCGLIELEAFRSLYGELRIYFDRVITISDLFEVAALSKEWQLIAETQQSFLPWALPAPDRIDIAVSYKPLLNVSGDYYDAISIDPQRTLFVLGDVSGKGLAAALIMGIIVNTIRVARDHADLVAIIRSVDRAVREMGFDDKYTVIFLGLVDTETKVLRYINAAMADPIVITQTALGPKLRRIEPTMGLVGLVPLDEEIVVEELPLHTDEMILLASDGVTEVTDGSGARLGETERFERTLVQSSRGTAEDFVGAITGMIYDYVGDQRLKDDVTMVAVKVGRLWD